ncbi:hypothetical protein Smic_17920 [Streptomyces microflavus]|uniref:Lon N-terminal domain-containing protein n=1 Tax=Streptomyces microflavus TaxID=1919 RepID=A0A7J0CL83_STRMI|nr:hypothetical protein Smic_17920 [Streptomyces microflavus]
MTTARLPLFPLNAVLFPGLVLPLNVFEERYRAMMRELLKSDEDEPRRFVVVAIRDGRETAVTGTGMPDPVASAPPAERAPAEGFGPDPIQTFHRVGCIADAATIRERPDGSFEVLATGTTRVRLLSVDASGPYLSAEVEEVAEEPPPRTRPTRPGPSRRASCGRSAPTRSVWPERPNARSPPAPSCPTTPPSSPTWSRRPPSWTSPPNSGCSRPRTPRPACARS